MIHANFTSAQNFKRRARPGRRRRPPTHLALERRPNLAPGPRPRPHGMVPTDRQWLDAGLILVDRDSLIRPEDDLRTTEILWTMVGGKVVFKAP